MLLERIDALGWRFRGVSQSHLLRGEFLRGAQVVKRWLAISMLALGAPAGAQDTTVERTTTIAALFPADEAQALSKTLAADKPLRFRVRVPQNTGSSGVLVFVKPTNNGELPANWAAVLDQKNLIWIAADDFGNELPRAQRVLAAMTALRLIESTQSIDSHRVYVGGMSGGGRVASAIITRFPQRFRGALYIVGADPWTSAEQSLLPRIAANRYVFVTGPGDFNQREMKRLFARYQAAGVTHALLMDLPAFGHEYPNAEQFGKAVDFLDAR
jgi:pimeloyl-ACP methyl ester carboxylesterase